MSNSMEYKSKLIAIAVTTSLLMSSSGYLYYDNKQIESLNEKQKIEINSLALSKSKLHHEISNMKSQLDQYKGKNKELDDLVAKANKEIVYKEQKIKKLLSDNASMNKIQSEVYQLRTLNTSYVSRIKELEEKFMALTGENKNLIKNNSLLKERLVELEERNKFLERKVSVASVLMIENTLVLGEKKIKSGKFSKTKLRKADRFLVSFDVVENKVTEAGEKVIYVRITDPKGNLLQNGDSGSFMNFEDNIDMPFTQKVSVNYTNEKQKVVVPIELSGSELEKGKYNVEFFSDGYFCGVKKLKL